MRNRLTVLRAERDWSQTDLAERIGVSRQAVTAIFFLDEERAEEEGVLS